MGGTSYIHMLRHLGCIPTLAFAKHATTSIGVHISFQISVFIFSGYIPRSEIAGSYDSSIFRFLGGAEPVTCRSSRARGQTHATAGTQATAVTILGLQPAEQSQRSNFTSSSWGKRRVLNLPTHHGNSTLSSF